ncbi:cytochrome c biogenesis CcdA family protein [Fusibacter sp. 3D3]|uniref:cytochrome c biogenesis CcdA family protein n=1 Tax=Fusibacter sp. 3D3 TaxID=1048380 RepID=UPI0008537A7C|nr:cytochrome c biogenesis CcdA family protein [Fusibacter sp. 3D3]GAU77276.1 cytochrome c-type biogenesis protein CcdA [Fusibacter sp. 3D3]
MVVYMSTVFIAGFISFFAPCTFPLLPVYIGVLTDQIEDGKYRVFFNKKIAIAPILKTLLFIAGLSTTFMILGFGAGALGSIIHQSYFYKISGVLVILLGLHQMGVFRIKFLEKYKVLRFKEQSKNAYFSTYLLGLTFSFAWTPCVGPVLGAVLVISAGGGQAFYGAFLMLLYTLGLAFPFMIFAVFTNFILSKFERIEAHLNTIKIIGGLLVVAMGVLLMTQNLNQITAFIEKLN